MRRIVPGTNTCASGWSAAPLTLGSPSGGRWIVVDGDTTITSSGSNPTSFPLIDLSLSLGKTDHPEMRLRRTVVRLHEYAIDGGGLPQPIGRGPDVRHAGVGCGKQRCFLGPITVREQRLQSQPEFVQQPDKFFSIRIAWLYPSGQMLAQDRRK